MRTVVPATFELALQLACPAGRIANTGVHGEPDRDAEVQLLVMVVVIMRRSGIRW